LFDCRAFAIRGSTLMHALRTHMCASHLRVHYVRGGAGGCARPGRVRTGPQYWFFLRKVVCKTCSVFSLSRRSAFGLTIAVATQGRCKVAGSLLFSAAAATWTIKHVFFSGGRSRRGQPPVDNRRCSKASDGRSLSRVAEGHFASKTRSARPCTAAHTQTLASDSKTTFLGMPPGEGICTSFIEASVHPS